MNKCLVVLSQQVTCNALCTMACRIRFLWIHRLVANLAVSTSLLDYGFALGVRLSHDNFDKSDSLEIADSRQTHLYEVWSGHNSKRAL